LRKNKNFIKNLNILVVALSLFCPIQSERVFKFFTGFIFRDKSIIKIIQVLDEKGELKKFKKIKK